MTKLIFLACECCHALNEESAVVTREEIAVMPNGEWLCDNCYRDCDKTQYGFVPEDREDFDYPDFDDMPRPPLITAIYEETTRYAEVAACPFCGGKAGLQGRQFSPDPERYYVRCYTCDASGPMRDHESIARRDWNGITKTSVEAA